MISLVWTGYASAVVAAPVEQGLTQPDGREFAARQWGDERLHGWETIEGYTVVRDEAGYWSYAEAGGPGGLKSTGVIVGLAPPEGLRRGVRPKAGVWLKGVEGRAEKGRGEAPRRVVPPTGVANIPVILVNFSDTATTYTAPDFEALLFGSGNKSLKDYYEE
ncbi:MAG TPA: hypothetical protein ENJ04_11030, partial [Nitrospirae bacterium]|nr:hypothetical protein [Nitrospirota bacterium]